MLTSQSPKGDWLSWVRCGDVGPAPTISRSCRVQEIEVIYATLPNMEVDVRVTLTDALIAATAIEHGLPVVTQDADFDQIAQACPALSVIRV